MPGKLLLPPSSLTGAPFSLTSFWTSCKSCCSQAIATFIMLYWYVQTMNCFVTTVVHTWDKSFKMQVLWARFSLLPGSHMQQLGAHICCIWPPNVHNECNCCCCCCCCRHLLYYYFTAADDGGTRRMIIISSIIISSIIIIINK